MRPRSSISSTTRLPARCRVGIPQGSAISPSFFNHFVSDCSIPDQDMTSYADDFTLLPSAPSIVEAEARANQPCSSLVRWAEGKQLAIAPLKSSVTLFTSVGSEDHYRLSSKSRDVPPQSRDCGHLHGGGGGGALRTVISAVLCQRPPTLAPSSFNRHLPSRTPPPQGYPPGLISPYLKRPASKK